MHRHARRAVILYVRVPTEQNSIVVVVEHWTMIHSYGRTVLWENGRQISGVLQYLLHI